MSAKKDIKTLLLDENITIRFLAEKMTEVSGKKLSANFLSQKLTNNTLRYCELELICEILGYKIEYKKL